MDCDKKRKSETSNTNNIPNDINKTVKKFKKVHYEKYIDDKKEEKKEKSYEYFFEFNSKVLLLLRHASKCDYSDNKCPVSSSCSKYKKLWLHLLSCKDNNCLYSHCISSRRLLTHFRNCSHNICKLCFPVKNAIKQKNDLISTVVNIFHQEKKNKINKEIVNSDELIKVNNDIDTTTTTTTTTTSTTTTTTTTNNNNNKLNLKINTASLENHTYKIPPSIITPNSTEFSSSSSSSKFSPLNNYKDTYVFNSNLNFTNIENIELIKKKIDNHESRIKYCEKLLKLLNKE